MNNNLSRAVLYPEKYILRARLCLNIAWRYKVYSRLP